MPRFAFPDLPVTPLLPALVDSLESTHNLVLEAAPGAGKTTLVPLALLEAGWLKDRRILVLEPRRIAARAAAERMAELLGEPVGKTVGYRIRMEKKVSRDTVIEVVTEGILTRQLQHDPSLEQVAAVIFDEFHERNIHSDLGLALCLQAQELFRDDSDPLKLVVMSATLDGERLSGLLGHAPRLHSEGRAFPVDTVYCNRYQPGADIADAMAPVVRQAHQQHSGNLLVFLPGQREIQALEKALQNSFDAHTHIHPLHGSLPLARQREAIAAPPAGQRKIVLTTDIAETSLTTEGVSVVVDSGLARKPAFDSKTGTTRLHTRQISRASATQRAGRAGRLSAGFCYRLWSEQQQAQLIEQIPAEIQTSDLAPLALQLLQWGVDDPAELRWLDQPPAIAYQQAITLLTSLGAVSDRKLTDHGTAMTQMPVHPRYAHMLLTARRYGLIERASLLAAALSDRVPVSGTDIRQLLEILEGERRSPPAQEAWVQRTRQQARLLRQQSAAADCPADPVDGTPLAENDTAAFLLALAWPDRIARQRDTNRQLYQLSNGRAAKLNDQDPLATSRWLAVADLGGISGQREDRIFLAAPLNPGLFDSHLASLVTTGESIEWQGDRLVAERQRCLGRLILSATALPRASDEQRSIATVRYIRERGLEVLPWTEELRQWQARVLLAREHSPEHHWPDVSDHTLTTTLESWLQPWLTTVRSTSELKKVKLSEALAALLPWPLPQQLDQLVPERLQVPSGSRIAIDYRQCPPVLEVKLQEMFGARSTPAVVNGRVPLLVHLLSPARRPLQITQDLEGFWNSSYQEVKKEMKGRYPKHPWPDNPWEQPATRLTKKRL